MELEVDFFQAAMKDSKQPKIGLLVLDFDETLSVSDTTSVIIDTAIASAEAPSKGGLISTLICTCSAQESACMQLQLYVVYCIPNQLSKSFTPRV